MTLVLTQRDVRTLLGFDECITAVEAAFRLHAEGRSLAPGVLGVPSREGGFHIKAAGLERGRLYFAAKTNANFSGNPRRNGLPAIQGVIVLCDGMVWSELGAAMPASGGSFGYLREAYGRETYGRLMAFLFVWQFILSGPLEIASGYIGFANYLGYIWTGLARRSLLAVCAAVGVVNILLLFRRITSIAKITVTLWIGTLLTAIAIVVTGMMHFEDRKSVV